MGCNVKFAEIQHFSKGTIVWVGGVIDHCHVFGTNQKFEDNVRRDILLALLRND